MACLIAFVASFVTSLPFKGRAGVGMGYGLK